MKKATQAEFDSLAKRYNEVRSLCDSYLTEIAELKQRIAKLETDLEIDVCLRRYQFGDDVDDK
jgi:peptidoglycan hydrolase CwlO-like protein